MGSNRIGDSLRRYRQVLNLTQAELAVMLDLTQVQVSAIETGRRVVDGELLEDIALLLDLPHLLEDAEEWADE